MTTIRIISIIIPNIFPNPADLAKKPPVESDVNTKDWIPLNITLVISAV